MRRVAAGPGAVSAGLLVWTAHQHRQGTALVMVLGLSRDDGREDP